MLSISSCPSKDPLETRGHWRVFPIQSRLVGIRTVKKTKELRGGELWYVAQATPQLDAQIAGKGHLWMETSSNRDSQLTP